MVGGDHEVGIGGRAERGASSATMRRGDSGLGGGEGELESGRRRLDDAVAVAGAGRGEVGLRG